jgi:hypothetical protein
MGVPARSFLRHRSNLKKMGVFGRWSFGTAGFFWPASGQVFIIPIAGKNKCVYIETVKTELLIGGLGYVYQDVGGGWGSEDAADSEV